MKPRLISWTMAALLLTALGLGCAGSDNNPFGSSANGGGGGGGGGAGTTAFQLLSNNVVGAYNGLTPAVSTGPNGSMVAGIADPLPGGASSTLVTGGGPAPGNPAAYYLTYNSVVPSGLPIYGTMQTWTLQFDIEMLANVNNINNISVYWGNGMCAVEYTLPKGQLLPGQFNHFTITPSMFLYSSGCTTPLTGEVYAPFSIAITDMVPGAGAAGFYIDNIKWTY